MSLTGVWSSRSLEEVAAYAQQADPGELCETLAFLAGEHDAAFNRTLDLVASHGLLSPRARAMLGTGLMDKMRQAGLPGSRVHGGAEWIDRIETIAVELAKRLFGVRYAELRPLSCAYANGVVFAALTDRGDTVVAQTRFHGADPTATEQSHAGLLGLRYVDLPYDEDNFTVDVEEAASVIEAAKPRLVLMGSGHILFPYPVRELRAVAEAVGAKIFYDGAHAVGLTAGGEYQDPIADGADVVTGSAPKTLCGPTGGMVLTNDPEIASAVEKMTSRLTSSYPNSNLGALAVTLAEMLHFGRAYARTVVGNARALARGLDEQGITVLAKRRGFTQSHIVLMDVTDLMDAAEAVRRLDAAGLFVTRKVLPPDSPVAGIRLGTASVTRRGMGEPEMTEAAALIRRVVVDGEPPERVALDVAELASAFDKVHYCFE